MKEKDFRGMSLDQILRSTGATPVKNYKALKEILTPEDIVFLSYLTEAFFDEMPAKLYKSFLQEYCYTDEDFVRVMNKLKRKREGDEGKADN